MEPKTGPPRPDDAEPGPRTFRASPCGICRGPRSATARRGETAANESEIGEVEQPRHAGVLSRNADVVQTLAVREITMVSVCSRQLQPPAGRFQARAVYALRSTSCISCRCRRDRDRCGRPSAGGCGSVRRRRPSGPWPSGLSVGVARSLSVIGGRFGVADGRDLPQRADEAGAFLFDAEDGRRHLLGDAVPHRQEGLASLALVLDLGV